MIYKSPSPISGRVRVTFELPSCIWADRIFLVGDFNQWSQNATPMRQERDGVWRAVLDLEHGRQCEFRYLIDGQWCTDYHADGATGNGYGTENSVVRATLPEEANAAGGWPPAGALWARHQPPTTRRQRTAFAPVRVAA